MHTRVQTCPRQFQWVADICQRNKVAGSISAILKQYNTTRVLGPRYWTSKFEVYKFIRVFIKCPQYSKKNPLYFTKQHLFWKYDPVTGQFGVAELGDSIHRLFCVWPFVHIIIFGLPYSSHPDPTYTDPCLHTGMYRRREKVQTRAHVYSSTGAIDSKFLFRASESQFPANSMTRFPKQFVVQDDE